MAGQTNNNTALDALNQLIVAVNDLNVNTVLTNIQTAISNLQQELADMQIIINNQGCACGGSGCSSCGGTGFTAEESGAGSSIDQPTYTQPDQGAGAPPPSDWQNWDDQGGEQGYNSYKCNAANVLILGMAESLAKLCDFKNMDYSQFNSHSALVNTLVLASEKIDVIIGGWLGLGNVAPSTLAVNVRQWTAEKIADYFYPTAQASEFQIFCDLRLEILNNRSDRVCDLYTATSTTDAKNNLLAAIDTALAGMAYSQSTNGWAREIIEGNLSHAWLNQLWQHDTSIAAYSDTSATDCNDCACQHTITGTIDPSPGIQTWQSAVSANENEISLGYCCNGTAMLDVTFDSISGWTDRGAGYIDFRLFSICDNFPTNGDIYDNTNTFPTGQRYCFKTLVFWSSTPFSIGVTVHGEC